MLKAQMVAMVFGVSGVVSALTQAPQGPSMQPPARLQPGETPVAGQCLTQQELDLIKGLQALTRPTRGAEYADHDDQMRFDPRYFVGTWRIEGVLPESPLGAAGEFSGIETVRYAGNCAYESTIQAKLAGTAFTVKALQVYDRKARYMVRLEQDSRGFQLLKTGPVGGDSGGYFTHHWEVPAFVYKGKKIRLTGSTFLASPVNHRLRMMISVDDQPPVNYGTTWWRRQESSPK
jgi:hypothetical protein